MFMLTISSIRIDELILSFGDNQFTIVLASSSCCIVVSFNVILVTFDYFPISIRLADGHISFHVKQTIFRLIQFSFKIETIPFFNLFLYTLRYL